MNSKINGNNISHGRKAKFATTIRSTYLETISLSQLMEKFLINKNQAEVDTFISARQWQPSKSLFHNHFVDALMLKILYIYSVSYFYSNGILL